MLLSCLHYQSDPVIFCFLYIHGHIVNKKQLMVNSENF